MKKKVDELEQKLHALETEKLECGRRFDEIKCKKCEQDFGSKKDLREHFRESYPQEIDCIMCSNRFARYCELELHLENNHKSKKILRML